jgi:hypothetical protein
MSKEVCEGCGDKDARKGEYGAQCAECEAYLRHHDAGMASLAIALEAWRERHGLSREGAAEIARELLTLRADLQDGLMSGRTWQELRQDD